MNNKWCEKCKGSYPIYTCKLTDKYVSKYQVINHCMNGGNECQKKIEVKKLKLEKKKGDNNGKLV